MQVGGRIGEAAHSGCWLRLTTTWHCQSFAAAVQKQHGCSRSVPCSWVAAALGAARWAVLLKESASSLCNCTQTQLPGWSAAARRINPSQQQQQQTWCMWPPSPCLLGTHALQVHSGCAQQHRLPPLPTTCRTWEPAVVMRSWRRLTMTLTTTTRQRQQQRAALTAVQPPTAVTVVLLSRVLECWMLRFPSTPAVSGVEH